MTDKGKYTRIEHIFMWHMVFDSLAHLQGVQLYGIAGLIDWVLDEWTRDSKPFQKDLAQLQSSISDIYGAAMHVAGVFDITTTREIIVDPCAASLSVPT